MTVEAKLVRNLSGNTTIGELVGTAGSAATALMPFLGFVMRV